MRLTLIAFAVLLAIVLPCACFSQTLAQGSVVNAQILPTGGKFVWDFELCCGISDAVPQPKGFANAYSYNDGKFVLMYTDKAACKNQCEFNGTFSDWFTPIVISKFCVVQTATLTGSFMGLQYWPDVTAEYAQVMCQQGDVFWVAGGDLTLHLAR
jgi:hypothetical protein